MDPFIMLILTLLSVIMLMVMIWEPEMYEHWSRKKWLSISLLVVFGGVLGISLLS